MCVCLCVVSGIFMAALVRKNLIITCIYLTACLQIGYKCAHFCVSICTFISTLNVCSYKPKVFLCFLFSTATSLCVCPLLSPSFAACTAACLFRWCEKGVCVSASSCSQSRFPHWEHCKQMSLPGNTVKQWSPRATGQSARGGSAHGFWFRQQSFHWRARESVL